MRKSVLFLFAICLFVSTALEAKAQAAEGPPKVLSIFREEIKAGRGSAHVKIETGYVRALQKANWPVFSLAMTPAAGGTDTWFISGYDSFAALEKDRLNLDKHPQLSADFERLDAMDADFRTGQRSIVCVLNEELSYGTGVDIAKMRYFSVSTVRVRPGHDREYTEARKMLVDAWKKAKADFVHSAVYQVVAGAPAGTYLIFVPRKTLAELDPVPERGKAIQEAMGEDNSKKRQKLLSESVMNVDLAIYAFSPRMSYVPREWAKSGGDFWTPKPPRPAAAKKPAGAEKVGQNK